MVTAHAAFLRVYEPLAAFEGEQRGQWQAQASAGAVPSPTQGAVVEREAAVRAVVGRPPVVLPQLRELGYVTEVDGVTMVCPWRTRLRALEALEEFAEQLPDVVLSAFVPGAVRVAAAEELDRLRAADGDLRSHQLLSTWHVPLRWFVLVEAGERLVSVGTDGDSGRSLVYRTVMSRARRRTARALAVLRRTVDDAVVTAGVEDLGRWLEEFHPRSLVELDYGGLVHLLDDDALQGDESARDVAAALTALGQGDQDAARAAYARVTGRMKALQAVESAN